MRPVLNAVLWSAVFPFAALAEPPVKAVAEPGTRPLVEDCKRLDADRQRAGDAWMTLLTEDLRNRSDADSMATLAALEASSAARGAVRAGEDGLSAEQREKMVEAAAEGGRAAFARLWPRRDALAWSQLYPLFEHHRHHLDVGDRQRWEAYLIQRAGRSMHAFALRVRALQESDAAPEVMDALLDQAAREGEPAEDIHYDAMRRFVPALSRVPVPAALRTLREPCDQLGEGLTHWELSESSFVTLTASTFAMSLIPLREYPSEQCNAQNAAPETQRADACRRIARMLALEGRTLLARGIGAGYWQRLARNPAEQAAALQAKRQARWWLEEGLAQLGYEPGQPRHWPARTEATTHIILEPGSSELEAARRALREAGLGDSPPEAWMPVNPASLQP